MKRPSATTTHKKCGVSKEIIIGHGKITTKRSHCNHAQSSGSDLFLNAAGEPWVQQNFTRYEPTDRRGYYRVLVHLYSSLWKAATVNAIASWKAPSLGMKPEPIIINRKTNDTTWNADAGHLQQWKYFSRSPLPENVWTVQALRNAKLMDWYRPDALYKDVGCLTTVLRFALQQCLSSRGSQHLNYFQQLNWSSWAPILKPSHGSFGFPSRLL